ncbi:MAG TPA: tryptophan 2,3-dioxygenase family protein [Mycobacteriales bacterium]|nr:tryptophan 2,3-dioxygenase family protein [Mycobacteriales bacterium]
MRRSPAPGFLRRGAAFAAVGYGLAPAYRVADMVGMVRQALRMLLDAAPGLGVDPARVVVSGSSAGAHLVAMALTDPDLAQRLAGAVLLSGIYDLEPITRTYVNDPLGLDAGTARALSPLPLLGGPLPPLVVARGGAETAEFARQHDSLVTALRGAGAEVTDLVVEECDHFDLPFRLADPGTALGRAVLDLAGLPLAVPEPPAGRVPDLGVSSDAQRRERAEQTGGRPTVDFPAGSTPYIDYQSIDVLLSLQHHRTDAPGEPTFYAMGQVKELLFKLLHTELRRAQRQLRADAVRDAVATLLRTQRVFELLTATWSVLDTLSPTEFAAFRDHLGQASGFQSYMYRRVEFVLGNKVESMTRPHRGVPHVHRDVLADFRSRSLYDEALLLLHRRGADLPAELVHRDWSVPHEPHPAVEAAWAAVYRDPRPDNELYQLAEALVGVAQRFSAWRLHHLLTVEKVIGPKPGTGGTGGVEWLRRIAGHRFFPELWTVRGLL